MWLKSLFRRKQREQDLEDEINSHIAQEIQERIERGESPEEARIHARRDFGNVSLVKDATRDVWAQCWWDEIRQDVRYALRSFNRTRSFTVAALFALTLGIGSTT